jgi:hypothetical protein
MMPRRTRLPRLVPLLTLSLAALTPALAAWAAEPLGLEERLATVEAEVSKLRAELVRLQELLAHAESSEAEAVSRALARVTQLEAELKRLDLELQELREEQRAASDDANRLSDAESRRPSLGVYGVLDFAKYQGESSVLDAQAFEIVISGRPHPRLGYFAEIEFERVAGVGGERGGEIVVEQAYANFRFLEVLNLRAGVLLVPFGNVNVDHFAPMRDVISKPIVAYVVAPSDWTDNGLGFFGRQVAGERWLLDYEAYVVAGLGEPIDAFGSRAARQGYGVDNNDDKALVGRLTLNRLGRFQVGLSGYTGKYDGANRLRLNGWAVDGLAMFGPLKLTGEYDSLLGDGGSEPDVRLHGLYVRAVFELGPGLLPKTVTRDFDEAKLQLVYQYDDVKTEGRLEEGLGRNHERRHTAGINFRPSEQWVLKLNREWNSTENQPLVHGDRDGWLGSIGFVF